MKSPVFFAFSWFFPLKTALVWFSVIIKKINCFLSLQAGVVFGSLGSCLLVAHDAHPVTPDTVA